MTEILITSTALILALLLLRRVFRGTLSRRVQYALWGLVLVRLLVPVQLLGLPSTGFSVLTATRPMEQAVLQQVNRQLYYSRPAGQVTPEQLREHNISDISRIPTAEDSAAAILSDPPAQGSAAAPRQGYLVRDPETNTVTLYEHMAVGPWEFLSAVWKAGMAVMTLFFLGSNLLFWQKLRRVRRKFTPEDGPARKVYLVPDGVIPSPCLFGRAIYLTPAAVETPAKLRHVLCHEETHAKHWDPLWSLLRCVCLTVYWFDPFVWVAAACSKTDCELACDEGVLKALGEAERIPYGQTLLSLIPVKKTSNPLLAATTMTAGKRQLKDRVTRIAKGSRQMAAAVLAVAVLAGAVSACTFTGAKPTEVVTPTPTESSAPEDTTLRSLTGEELRWFNEEFFNNSNSAQDYTYNIRTQFANPIILYDKPEDIDLYQLFYLEGSAPSDEELKVVFDSTWDDLPCAAYKLTTAEANNILIDNTGLTLEQANKDSLTYEYRPEYDAYYWMHGDTNYCGTLNFTCGTREGNIYKLYHHSYYDGNRWCCVTLERQDNGGYHFRSNQICAQPAIPTPLPGWEPIATLSLTEEGAYVAPPVTIENRSAEGFSLTWPNNRSNWNIDGHHVSAALMPDGLVRAAVRREDGTLDVFLTVEEEEYQEMSFFDDLFGHNGFYVHYRGATPGDYYGDGGASYGSIYEYFYFDEDGTLVRLLRCPWPSPEQVDLNGDGVNELIFHNGFFFQRDGVLYRADLEELIQRACPELETWDYAAWDRYGKYFSVRGYTETYKDYQRYAYFDGENLLIYKNETPTVDHMLSGADQGVPALVVEKARETAEKAYQETQNQPSTDEYGNDVPTFDDWRITGFNGPYTNTLGGVTIQGWHFAYEGHTNEPEKVILAGERTLSEDSWTSFGPWGLPNIIFVRQEEDASLSYLWTGFDDGTLESYGGTEGLLLEMEEHGVKLGEGFTYPELRFRMQLEWITSTYYDYQKNESSELRIQYDDGQGGGGTYIIDPQEGNGNYFMGQMKDNYVVWSRPEGTVTTPDGPSVTLSDAYWHSILQFWQDSGLVMFKEQNREPEWYEVTYDGDPAQDVFAYRAVPYYWARSWFDEAQWANLTDSIAAISDAGQGHRAIAQTWIESHEGVMTQLFPGGSMTCSYVKAANVEILENQPEGWFPADILNYPHFAFRYSVIFVPENEDALNTLMAGNTGEYEGNDPDVPEGAYEYSRQGSMYLKDGYWYCAGVGTG